MHKMFLASVGLLALCGCASSGNSPVSEAAALQCQTVGIAKNDPAFDVCAKAYMEQNREDALQANYKTLNALGRGPHRLNGGEPWVATVN